MTAPTFTSEISSAEALREYVGEPADAARDKAISYLDVHCRAFIEKAPFLILGTSDADGRCDVSPKGDAPGFVRVLDDHTLAIPDRPGNRRADSLANLVANPHAALLFMVPGTDETLRVEGRVRIVTDESLRESMAVNGKAPHLVIVVEVESAFLHCAKCIRRSSLWQQGTWPERGSLPTAGQILRDHAALDLPAGQIDAAYQESTTKLY